jgi:hypothetical protein
VLQAYPESSQYEQKLVEVNNIWKSCMIPFWFKDKLIKLAPKIFGNNQLDNMQSISLYEIIRKIWTTIVARRINEVWLAKGLLHDAQYGYKLDNGTRMPLFSVIKKSRE